PGWYILERVSETQTGNPGGKTTIQSGHVVLVNEEVSDEQTDATQLDPGRRGICRTIGNHLGGKPPCRWKTKERPLTDAAVQESLGFSEAKALLAGGSPQTSVHQQLVVHPSRAPHPH